MSSRRRREEHEAELRARLGRLTLEQKVNLLTGAGFWRLRDEPSIGLRQIVVSDGPVGVRGERLHDSEPSANLPCPTALAATWDERRVESIGMLLAAQARSKGVDVVLAPTVNIQRTPYGGRHFECYSEDPLLTGRIGSALVRGLQSGGVSAAVKHFVGNDTETQRFTYDARISERALREVYLLPFELIIKQAGAWAIMAAYNRVNGHTMTESPLLRAVLHDEWGFDGVTVSDWFATRSTVGTANAGLDLAMPGPRSPWSDALVAAVRDGMVEAANIDDKVLRILRLAARVGALSGVDSGARAAYFSDVQVAAQVRAAATAGSVLARNHGVLPFDPRGLRSIAVLGPNAAEARTLGGGSATVVPPYTISPLEGIRAALPGLRVLHRAGVRPSTRVPAMPVPLGSSPGGLAVRYLSDDGTVLAEEVRRAAKLTWLGDLAPGVRGDVARIETRTEYRAGEPGVYTFGVSGIGRFEFQLDGTTVFDGVLTPADSADVVETLTLPPQFRHDVPLRADQRVEVAVVHHVAPAAITSFQLNVATPYAGDDAEIEAAVEAAAGCDAAVVVVGTTDEAESEGFDRRSLALPGRQDELVRRVLQANPRTVVVVNSGAPVLMPWFADAPAVLLTWFGGQESGSALADMLLGFAEPGGRLPTSWPAAEHGLASTMPIDGVLAYTEGIAVGYRGGPSEGLPFGHGLGYTTWDYLSAETEPGTDGAVTVRVLVRNSGDRAGREVVQVYLSRPMSAVERPARWLAGFATIDAQPGSSAMVDVVLARRAFEHWDTGANNWQVEPGEFTVHVGRSSAAEALRTSWVYPLVEPAAVLVDSDDRTADARPDSPSIAAGGRSVRRRGPG